VAKQIHYFLKPRYRIVRCFHLNQISFNSCSTYWLICLCFSHKHNEKEKLLLSFHLIACTDKATYNTRIVARKTSGGYKFVREGWRSNLTNIPLIYNVSYFDLGDLKICLVGLTPPPWQTGLYGTGYIENTLYYFTHAIRLSPLLYCELARVAVWRCSHCCDRKSRAACAQSFALWQQARIEFTCHDHSINACSRHVYYRVVLHAYRVRGESHI